MSGRDRAAWRVVLVIGVMASIVGWLVSRSVPDDIVAPSAVMAIGLPDGLTIAALDGRVVRRIRDDGPYFEPAWSADGSLIAVTTLSPRDANDLLILQPDGALVAEVPGVFDIRWAPKGHRLAVNIGARRSIAVVDLDAGRKLDLRMPDDVDVLAGFSWSLDGRTIVAGVARAGHGRNGELWLLDTAGGVARRWIDATPAGGPAWSTSGDRIAGVFSRCPDSWCESDIRILDASTGQRRSEILDLAEPANLAWSPNARYLAFDAMRAGERDVFIFDLETGTVTRIPSGSTFDLVRAWAPDGTGVIVARRGPSGSGAGSAFWLVRDEHAASMLAPDANGVAIQPRP